MKQSKIKSTKDVFQTLAEGLRGQSVRPNVYGYVPHSKQLEFHASSCRKKLFLAGNRVGKTVAGAVESVWWLTKRHPYVQTPELPVKGRCVSVDLLHGVEQIVKPEIARWLPASDLLGGSWQTAYNRELRVLTLENKSTLEFLSYEQDVDKFAGTSRDFVWFDESPPRDIYIECLQRLLDKGGSLWMTLTPLDGMSSWIYDELYLAAKEDTSIKVVTAEMSDNPHLNIGEIEQFLSGLTKDELEARKKGKFIQIGGLIYKMWNPHIHVIEEIPISTDWLHVVSLDHGFNNPTAVLWAQINSDGKIIVYDEWYKSGEIIKVHAQKIHEYNDRHKREPDYYVADPSIRNVDPITGTSVLLEYVEYGIPFTLGNNDVQAGLNRVARYLTGVNEVPQLYVTKSCPNLIREMGRLRWSTWASSKMRSDKNKKEEQHKKEDHAPDSLRYLICSRPELDDGTQIPVGKNSKGYPTALSAQEDRVDKDMFEEERAQYDEYIGMEY